MRYTLGYTFTGTLTSLASLWILYHVLTGQGERVSFAWFLETTSPYMWACLGIALSVALSVVGAALGIHTTGEFLLQQLLESEGKADFAKKNHHHMITFFTIFFFLRLSC